MKVWITKYALTKGIVEAEAILFGNRLFIMPDLGIYYLEPETENKEWSLSKEKAIEIAESMKLEQISSLKKQIERLEKLRFE